MCRVFEEARNDAATEATAKATADLAAKLYIDGKLSLEDAIGASELSKEEFDAIVCALKGLTTQAQFDSTMS